MVNALRNAIGLWWVPLVALACALSGVLVWWLTGRGHGSVVNGASDGSSQVIDYDGVRVKIPGAWERLDLGACEFEFEKWGPPTRDPCRAESGVSFYRDATFDPATGPGLRRVDGRADSEDAMWAGYVDAGDWAVYVQDSGEGVVRNALASVTPRDSGQ